jgi:shikimate kinase
VRLGNREPVWIIGPPGAGKTTVGRALSRRLGRPFVDLDARIEAAAGRAIPEIFAREGERRFRSRETSALEALACEVSARPAPIVACGGGVVSRARNRDLLAERGVVLWLDLPWREVRRRCARAPASRPLLADPERMARRLARRIPHYRALGRRVDAAGSRQDVLARALVALSA